MTRTYLTYPGLISALALAVSCGPSQKSDPAAGVPPVAVTTQQVTSEIVSGEEIYPATVVALNEVELRGEVGGYVTGIFVKDGDRVRKGQKLYEIDRSKYAAAYRQAQANLQIARSNRDKARKDAERYQKLAEQDAIARQRVDYALTDLANAESLIAASEAALANAAADVRRSTITAPFAGTVGISQVKLGSLVSPGSTLLNTLSSNNPIAVDIMIPQQSIPRFTELIKNSSGSGFTLRLPDNTVAGSGGKLMAIDRAVDSQTGTIRARVSYPNPGGKLIAGMNVTLAVRSTSPEPRVVIPYKAITEQLGEFTVFVVGDSSKVDQRHVQTGTKLGDRIVITEGLKEGETIVIEGVQNLRHGSLIQNTSNAR